MTSTAEGTDGALDRVEVYRLAIALSDLAWDDAAKLKQEPLLLSHASQLVRAIGSIAANVAEGYGRRSPTERVRYYEYALGSAEEARTWYRVSRHPLTAEALSERTAQLVSIRRLLLTMIRNERARGSQRTRSS